MARKSRKGRAEMQTIGSTGSMVTTVIAAATNERIWNCAVYTRLSVEDSGRKGADTIDIQIELVASYVKQRSDLRLADTYIDNGASGKDFDRPAWNRLMDDIRAGRIDCICVKDLSRFSRNYIETCEFLEKIFPFMGVRFISVNDGYDSQVTSSHNEGLIVALKSLVHDQHIKDISRKIHASVKARRDRGDYTRGFAPFGYVKVKVKSRTDANSVKCEVGMVGMAAAGGEKGTKNINTAKYKLEPDPETALIIQQIFQWRAEGISHLAICKRLDEAGIPTPNEYLRRKLHEKGTSNALSGDYFKSTIWRAQTLKGILANVAYIGSLQQGTQIQRLYANQSYVDIPRDQWIITENAHEPIISRELFDKIQVIEADTRKAYEASGKRPKRTENIFKGFPVCGVCGSKMSRVYSEKKMIHADPWVRYYFSCPIARQHKSEENEVAKAFRSIKEDTLVNAVFPLVADELRKAANLADVIKKRAKQQINPRALLDKEINRITYELKVINGRIAKLYEDYVDKLLDEREYVGIKAKYENRAEELRCNIDSLSERAAVMVDISTDLSSSNNRWLKAARDFQNPEKLTREMLEAIVDKIVISSSEHVEVVWKFKDELELLETCASLQVDVAAETIAETNASRRESA